MQDVLSYVCVGGVCVGPILMFVLGYALGSGRVRLPYKLVKTDDEYAVED
jgi:hypothetical protein